MGGVSAPAHGLCGNVGRLPSQSRLPPCQLPQRGSQVGALLKVCAKLSLASPFGGGGLALARTERASCQRLPRMGCVEALVGCPLSHGCRRASVSAAASDGRWATSHRDVAAPEGGAKSRLPPWGRWTRVSEDGEGKLPAAPSHGLCGSAGELPSQSPSGDSSPEGRAKSRLPLWGRCHAFGMTERAPRGQLLGTPPSGKNASLFP